MKVTLAVLADYANVSQEGKLNIMGIFNQLSTGRFPVAHPSMNLVLRLSAHPIEFGRPQAVRVALAGPDGEKIFELGGDITVQGEPGQTVYSDQILTLNNLVFPKAGDYSFDVLVNNNHEASVPLKVTAIAADTREGQADAPEDVSGGGR
jgi:hypothetical protein